MDDRPPPVRIAGFRQSDPQEASMAPTQPITPLRQRMLDDMKLRNMAVSTRKIYVASVAGFSAFHGRHHARRPRGSGGDPAAAQG
jgi:hypothetical protein